MSIKKLTKTETAELCGVSIRTITNWLNENDFPKNDDGTFSGPAVVQWLTARVEEKAGAATLTTDGQMWMTEFRKERALMARIEREKAEGLLISRDDAGAEWQNIVAVLCHGLELFADRLPPIMYGRNRYEMFEILRDEVWQLRNGLFKNGRYTPPVACDPWPEDTGKKAKMKPTGKKSKKCQIGKAKRKTRKRGQPRKGVAKKSNRGNASNAR